MTPPKTVLATVTELGEAAHTLVIGDRVFTLVPEKLPFGTLLKYAKSDIDLMTMHHLLVKLVHPDQLDDVWDALDDAGLDGGQEAIAKALESYTARPTKRP